ncbi:ATP-binding protein [Halarsenatibacter silvermanii]|uniref:Anti-sigma regulatory factor (Ser/Thr protein kinase) n=1 Tax=Halarsenatibacter silvermanii TaxID=321763 RepID=A0A1G9QLZ0_9FIRM|nr:ATP-binding protein [Halarsenatibacter silvermanii]SDM12044.1 Anti-sigma regulatory factor (Ser/Thr protein kinase) [Halarsenatibacter silvermanii]
MGKNIILEEEVEAQNFERGGEVSSLLKTLLTRLNIEPEIIRISSIITYELEMNIIIHSRGGKIKVSAEKEKLQINAIDQGPGIENINRALQPGFSTADQDVRELGFGAGMGLNNVDEYSDDLKIYSDGGTTVKSTVFLGREDEKDV